MNQPPDIDILVERGGLVDANWRKRLPHEAAPYTTVTVFLVRKGNPKAIKDWADLTRAGLQVIVPNPKTSGNGRYTYTCRLGLCAAHQRQRRDGARAFVTKLSPMCRARWRRAGRHHHLHPARYGRRLVTFENEALAIRAELGADKFDIVYPSVSIEASAPVALVDKVADKRGTRAVATAYLEFLFGPEGQAIIAKHNFRPRDEAVLAAAKDRFPQIATFSVESHLGGWKAVQAAHFADGALYDQIIQRR